MSEAASENRPRVVKILRYVVVCLIFWLTWNGGVYLRDTSVSGYKQARKLEMFTGAVNMFPDTSTDQVRLARFRYFNRTFMWANHILLARFEGVDTRFVDELRREHCREVVDDYQIEDRERKSKEKWDRYVGAVLTIHESFSDRRKNFEYCPVSYKELPGHNHTETVIWLEKGGRTAIFYGEFYSG